MFYYVDVLPQHGKPLGDEPNAARLTLTLDLFLRLQLLSHVAREHGITITADAPDERITWLSDPCEPGLCSFPQENEPYPRRIYGAVFHVYDGGLWVAGYLDADQTVGICSASFAVESLLTGNGDGLTKAPISDREELIAARKAQIALTAENERQRAHILDLRDVTSELCRIKDRKDREFGDVSRRAWERAVMVLGF